MNRNVQFVEEIKILLGERIKQSGSAFYSSATTLKKGKYLIVGLNPGGDPNVITNTIEESFTNFLEKDYNAYYETWIDNNRVHRLQKNLQELFLYLKEDLRKICAMNLFFERTKRERDLNFSSFPIYKQVLDKVLNLVQPQVIFTFGKRPFYALTEIFDFKCPVKSIQSGHGSWKILLVSGKYKGSQTKLIGFPHLSIYTLYNRRQILMEIKNYAETVADLNFSQ